MTPTRVTRRRASSGRPGRPTKWEKRLQGPASYEGRDDLPRGMRLHRATRLRTSQDRRCRRADVRCTTAPLREARGAGSMTSWTRSNTRRRRRRCGRPERDRCRHASDAAIVPSSSPGARTRRAADRTTRRLLPSRSPTTSRSSRTAAASDQLPLLMCRRSCEPVGEDGHAVLEDGRVGELELRRRRFGEQQIVGGAATHEERMEPEPQLVQ